MLYYLIIGLQLYCAYHAYKTKNHLYWYFIIFIAPGLGSLIYLITQILTKKDLGSIQDEFAAIIQPTKKINDLEKKVAFLDSFQNKQELADAYLENQDYPNAIKWYQSCLQGLHQNDYHIIKQLMTASYFANQFQQVITFGDKISENENFQSSKTRFLYGLSLLRLGRETEANEHFQAINVRYSNYKERLQLAKIYAEEGSPSKALALLNALTQEYASMSSSSKKQHRAIFRESIKEIKNIEKK